MTDTTTTVLIRADAGGRLGSGHVMRCLSLAAILHERGAAVEFVTRSPAWLVERIRSNGHVVHELAGTGPSDPAAVWTTDEQLQDASRTADQVGHDFDVVIVDHYGLGAPWESHFSAQSRMLAIDDLANRPHDVDVVTDQNWYGAGTELRYDQLVDPSTTRLLGPRYAVLQRAYQHLIRPQPVTHPPRRMVVSFGGTDPGGETAKVLRAVSGTLFNDLRVDVVLGSPGSAADELRALTATRPNTVLHVAVPTLAPLLARADLAIGASGAATWERLAAGVPAIVATVAPHQSGVTAALDAEGVTQWVGLAGETTPAVYRNALVDYLRRPPMWVPRVVDGYGAARLAEALIPSSPATLRRRRLRATDIGAIVGLRAEDSGVDESGSGLLGGPSAWRREESHFDELIRREVQPLIIEANGVPVAHPRPSDSATLIQRCVTDEHVRSTIETLGRSVPRSDDAS